MLAASFQSALRLRSSRETAQIRESVVISERHNLGLWVSRVFNSDEWSDVYSGAFRYYRVRLLNLAPLAHLRVPNRLDYWVT